MKLSPAAVLLIATLLLGVTTAAKWSEVCNSSNGTHCKAISSIGCVGDKKSTCYTGTNTGLYQFVAEPGSPAQRIFTEPISFLAVGGSPSAPGGVAVSGSTVCYFKSVGSLAKAHIALDGRPNDVRVSRDGKEVLIAGNTSVYYSDDAGMSYKWFAVPFAKGSNFTVASIAMASSKVWYATANSLAYCEKSVVMKTVDGGQSFKQVYAGPPLPVFQFCSTDIDCVDSKTCVLVGNGDSGAYAYQTVDGGNSWSQTANLQGGWRIIVSLSSVRFSAPQTAWFAGIQGVAGAGAVGVSDQMYVSNDSGASWKFNVEGLPQTATATLGMSFPAANGNGFAAVSLSNSNSDLTAVFRLTN